MRADARAVDGALASRCVEHPQLGTVEVRRLGAGDLDRFAGLLDGLSERSRRWFHPHGYDRADAEGVLAGAAGDDAQARWLLLVRHGGQEVAAGYGFLWNLRGGAPSLGIAVRDDFQRQGLGGVLMEFLLDAARSRGCTAVRLTVYDDNPRARRLYERFGFTTRRLVHHMQVDLAPRPDGPLGAGKRGATGP
jgi:ribosomal protein S18 acetylase RimI-like enzyme